MKGLALLGALIVLGRPLTAQEPRGMGVQKVLGIGGLFVQEPGLRSILTDSAARRLVSEGEEGRAKAAAAARVGNMTEAARLFVDRASGQPGHFDRLSPALKAMFVDNARTLSLEPGPAASITCEELGGIGIPVTITKGQLTKPSSRVLAEAAHRCIPQSELVTIANPSHGAPRENPSVFNAALLAFLARH